MRLQRTRDKEYRMTGKMILMCLLFSYNGITRKYFIKTWAEEQKKLR